LPKMAHAGVVGRKLPVPAVDTCWSVAAICFLVVFISTALERSSGLLYIAFMKEFGEDRQTASWPQSVMICITGLSGLTVGLLNKKYSTRHIAILGSITGWIGIMAAGFAPNIIWMSITLGVVHS
uniref:Uncharacterized protein n=2 Tax=Ixodes scapularis TaxID=6945 RepID=A0A1S4LXL4_IXOSC